MVMTGQTQNFFVIANLLAQFNNVHVEVKQHAALPVIFDYALYPGTCRYPFALGHRFHPM
jgi:hypothetical protein